MSFRLIIVGFEATFYTTAPKKRATAVLLLWRRKCVKGGLGRKFTRVDICSAAFIEDEVLYSII